MDLADDLKLLDWVVGVVSGVLMLVVGLPLLLKPESLYDESDKYRNMVSGWFRLLSREAYEAGRLKHWQIRVYGAVIVLIGLFFFLILLA
jgi:hypothetical protein